MPFNKLIINQNQTTSFTYLAHEEDLQALPHTAWQRQGMAASAATPVTLLVLSQPRDFLHIVQGMWAGGRGDSSSRESILLTDTP